MFFQVANNRFNDLYPALYNMYESNRQEQIEFKYHPEVFTQERWQTEPTDSFEHILDRYVSFLRSKYKHISLCWSGGSDSHTLYLAFKRNNLHIDTIITGYIEGHLTGHSTKVINWLDNNHYDKTTKIVSIDRTIKKNNTTSRFLAEMADLKWSLPITTSIPHHAYIETNLDSTYCLLTGLEKPYISKKNGIWYNYIPSYIVTGKRHATLGFLDPDFPDVAVKQTHLAIRNVEKFLSPLSFDSGPFATSSWQNLALWTSWCGRHPGIEIENIIAQRHTDAARNLVLALQDYYATNILNDDLAFGYINSPHSYIRELVEPFLDKKFNEWADNNNYFNGINTELVRIS